MYIHVYIYICIYVQYICIHTHENLQSMRTPLQEIRISQLQRRPDWGVSLVTPPATAPGEAAGGCPWRSGGTPNPLDGEFHGKSQVDENWK